MLTKENDLLADLDAAYLQTEQSLIRLLIHFKSIFYFYSS